MGHLQITYVHLITGLVGKVFLIFLDIQTLTYEQV